MLTTKRKPVTVGEMLTEEFMRPLGLTQGALAEAMGLVGTPTFIAGSDSRFGAISSAKLAELVAAARRN